MSYPSASLTYRRATVLQASPAGLAIALYDTLVADLQKAIAAIGRGAIEPRSQALKHGFQVLGELNSHIDRTGGGTAAANLLRFYEHLRRTMLAAQFSPDEALLTPLVSQILQVRAAWQQVDGRVSQLVNAGVSAAGNADAQEAEAFSCVA